MDFSLHEDVRKCAPAGQVCCTQPRYPRPDIRPSVPREGARTRGCAERRRGLRGGTNQCVRASICAIMGRQCSFSRPHARMLLTWTLPHQLLLARVLRRAVRATEPDCRCALARHLPPRRPPGGGEAVAALLQGAKRRARGPRRAAAASRSRAHPRAPARAGSGQGAGGRTTSS